MLDEVNPEEFEIHEIETEIDTEASKESVEEETEKDTFAAGIWKRQEAQAETFGESLIEAETETDTPGEDVEEPAAETVWEDAEEPATESVREGYEEPATETVSENAEEVSTESVWESQEETETETEFFENLLEETEMETESVLEEPEAYESETETEEMIVYPAQSFAYEGEVSVFVTAPEGALPENTSMVVTPVDNDDDIANIAGAVTDENTEKTVRRIDAVDITFLLRSEQRSNLWYRPKYGWSLSSSAKAMKIPWLSISMMKER